MSAFASWMFRCWWNGQMVSVKRYCLCLRRKPTPTAFRYTAWRIIAGVSSGQFVNLLSH